MDAAQMKYYFMAFATLLSSALVGGKKLRKRPSHIVKNLKNKILKKTMQVYPSPLVTNHHWLRNKIYNDLRAAVRIPELRELYINDDDLDRTTMSQLPKVVTKTQLTRLALSNCKMTEDKFIEMANSAKMEGIQIQEFFLTNMEMDEAAYHGIARVVGKAQTRILLIDACNITEKKLEAFGESAKANNAELEDMSIWNDPVDAATLREFAKTIKTVNANIVALGCFQPTAEKLRSFKQSVKQNNVKFKMLEIYNDEDLDDECYNEIIEICNSANADLQLSRFIVPDDRLRMLKMHIRDVIVLP